MPAALEMPPAMHAATESEWSRCLDEVTLDRLRELDPGGQSGLLQRVVAAYLSSSERLSEQLGAALDHADPAAVRMVAHTLKSSSASVGALALSAACAQTEAIARDRGMVPELEQAVTTLRARWADALLALRHLR